MGAVQFWIEPDNAGRATILPDQPGDEPADDDRDPTWVTEAPFRPLGFNQKIFYFLPANGQLLDLPGLTMSRNGLKMLAPKSFWRRHFDGKHGVRWGDAIDAIINYTGLTKGVFMPDAVRGRGVWRTEENEVVVHLGDRLLAPGDKKFTKPEDFVDGNHIYDRLPRVIGPSSTKAMSLEEAQIILDLFNSRAWVNEGSGALLLGWIVLAPFCGALVDWRPHIWLSGPMRSGKTSILKRMVMPLLGDLRVAGQGTTTEAAIRQRLANDAFPVICDEMEGSSKKAQVIVRGVLELCRSASYPMADVLKGTASGRAVSYTVSSMFLLSSIAVGLSDPADKSRFAIVEMKPPETLDPEQRRLDWIKTRRLIDQHVNQLAGRRLIARTLGWFRSGRFDKLLAVTKTAADHVLKDARLGDQYGTLAAGTWMMMGDDVPSESEVTDWYGSLNFGVSGEEDVHEGMEILSDLLQVREEVRISGQVQTMTVGNLIVMARKVGRYTTEADESKNKQADKALRKIGMRISPDGESLMISNQSTWVREQVADSSYGTEWWRLLRTIPGASAHAPVRFHSKLPKSRCTAIPIAAITSSFPTRT